MSSVGAPKWERVYRFDEMARMVNARVDDPSEADVDYYVGLEHLDPDSLTIRRWGSPEDVKATKLRFRVGDIIFGRRRVYQRKLAVAHFDGICSAHAMVLRANPKVALPEFLPFFMQSHLFMERAREISVGSLSPTINWKALADEEFALPPLDEQARLARVFSETEAIKNTYSESLIALRNVIAAFALASLEKARRAGHQCRLGEVANLKMGRQKAPQYQRGINPKPFLSVANIGELEITTTALESMDFAPDEFERFRLRSGDILVTEGDLISRFNVGRAAVFEGDIAECCFQNTLIRVRTSERLDVDYALLMLEGARLAGVFARAAKSTTVTHLGLGRLSDVPLSLPAMAEQKRRGEQLRDLLHSRLALRRQLRGAVELAARLSREIFG